MGLARIVGQRSSDQSEVMTWFPDNECDEIFDLHSSDSEWLCPLSNYEEWKKWFSTLTANSENHQTQTLTLTGLADGTFHFRIIICAYDDMAIDETGLYNLKYLYHDMRDGFVTAEMCGDFSVLEDEGYNRTFMVSSGYIKQTILQVWK